MSALEGPYCDARRRAAAGWTPCITRPSPPTPQIERLAREVLQSRLRPGWRLAIALPVVIALAAGLAELGHVAIGALRPVANHVAAAAVQAGIEWYAARAPDGGYPALGGCDHGGALVAAVAFGVTISVICILIGAALVTRRSGCRSTGGGDDDEGDGGDEDEIDPLFDDVERLVVIAVPRQDAPGPAAASWPRDDGAELTWCRPRERTRGRAPQNG